MKIFKKKRLILLTGIIALSSLTGCNFIPNMDDWTNPGYDEQGDNEFNNDEFDDESLGLTPTMYTIAELKEEYEVLGASQNDYMFKPFYNVEQTTEFTFHFNSNVDPIKAITVHTDAKCEENSTVYQINDGYKTANGVDVVVKPRNPVLGTDDRTDASDEYKWGYAPIYYLCIRYDLDSNEVEELDEPIVIPFTIKNKISTPNAYANIDEKGNFSVKWLPVKGAVSYRVYRATPPKATGDVREYSRAEYAYVGEFLKLEETLSSSKLEFTDEKTEKENLFFNKNGYINKQNYNFNYTYYITAVDAQGNESFFSKPIGIWQYENVVPYEVTNKSLGISTNYYIEEFSDRVAVTARDKETTQNYPINYYKIGTPSTYSHTCEYRYEVVGTALTGKITYRSENDEFPEEHISEYKLQTGLEVETPKDEIPSVDIDTIVDDEYENSNINLTEKVTYPEEAKIQYDPAILMIRADIEAARIISGTGYTKSLDTIESYVAAENPKYVLIVENGTIVVREAEESDFEDSTPIVKEEKTEEEEKKPAEDITNDNYVEEQRKSTEKQVEEADQQEVEGTEYPVFAETAVQKYLALMMINQEEEISLKAFPKYQNTEELWDDVFYVWYQNPYIMGINTPELMYYPDTQTLHVEYNVDDATAEHQQRAVYTKANSVVNSIIKTGMTDQEKVFAIYEYLEDSAVYHHEALDYATAGNNDFYKKYANCWNTYGILCEEKGVCQSYAYAFNLLCYLSDVDSTMVTGYMNNGGHAWNAVELDGTWYMVDTTNNGKSTGIPYWVCSSSYDFIFDNGFRFDDGFVDGTNVSEFKISDDTEDWYYVNDLMPKNVAECAKIWAENKDKSNLIIVKYPIATQEEMNTFVRAFVTEVVKLGYSQTDLATWGFSAASGVVALQNS